MGEIITIKCIRLILLCIRVTLLLCFCLSHRIQLGEKASFFNLHSFAPYQSFIQLNIILFYYWTYFILGDYYLLIHILSIEYYLPWQSIRQHSLTPSFTQGRLLFVLIFNIYIGQSNYLKISLLGLPMVNPTPVSHSIAIIYFVTRFFRLFPLYINGREGEFF